MSKISFVLKSLIVLMHVSSGGLSENIKSSEDLEPLDKVFDFVIIGGGFAVLNIDVYVSNSFSSLHDGTSLLTSLPKLVSLVEGVGAFRG